MNGRLLALHVLALVGLLHQEAKATCYACSSLCVKWPTASAPTYHYYSPDFGPQSTSRIQEAAAAWTSLAESALTITVQPTTTVPQLGNATSEIWFETESNGNGIARTFKWYSGDQSCGTPPCCNGPLPTITKSDIIFYGAQAGQPIPWLTGLPSGSSHVPGVDFYFFSSTLTHEMGHGVGLLHNQDPQSRLSVLHPSGGWFHTGSNRLAPLAVDRVDARDMYWASAANYSDIYMSNVTGGVEIIGVTPVTVSMPISWNPSTNEADFYPRRQPLLSGQPTNFLRVGDNLLVRMCYGNLGNAAASFTINVWMSTDKVRDSSDVLLGSSARPAQAAYSNACIVGGFLIPSGTLPATYYVYYEAGTGGNDIAAIDRSFTVIP